MAAKYKILVSDKLSEKGLKVLGKCPLLKVDVKTGMKPAELLKIIAGYDGLIIRSGTKVTAKVVEAAKKLKVIGRAGAGVDNIDVAKASKKGIAVENTPGGNTVTTGEHTMALLCALARNIPQGSALVKEGKWERGLVGVELMGKTLAIIGIGRVGSVVVRLAQGYKMNTIAYDPYISKEKAEELGVELVKLEKIWPRADFISIHSPLNDKTRHMISDKEFGKMKKGVRIVNCARGGIVDERALVKAIKSGKVAGAALDVFEKEPPDANNPLLKMSQVICTPHLGASSGEAQENVAIAVAEQIVAFFEKGLILNAVNVPSIDPELYKRIEPYLSLGDKLGGFLAQISVGGVKEIEITTSGEIADIDMKPLATSVLKGFLNVIAGNGVNFVNAPIIARERGIDVKTTVSIKAHDFTSLLTIRVVTDKGEQTVSGTIFGKKEPRIVNINGVYIEAVPEGNMLVFTNKDRPGVIGAVGTYLGKNKINIAQFRLGRVAPLQNAICIVNVDSDLPNKIIEGIQKLPNIIKAWAVKL